MPYNNFIFNIDTITEDEARKIKNKLKDIDRSKIIRTNRVGQGMAETQIGVDNASSEFLAFSDYDDILASLKKLRFKYEILKKEEADFSFVAIEQ